MRRISSVVRNQHLGHPCNAGSGVDNGGAASAGYQHVHICPELLCGSHRVQRGRFEFGVAVFGNNQGSHQITFASLRSLSTSSSTDPTLMPALRSGGGETFSVFTRGVTSTPSSAGVNVSSGFFFAFMMFGSEA